MVSANAALQLGSRGIGVKAAGLRTKRNRVHIPPVGGIGETIRKGRSMGFERFLSSMIRDGSLTVRIGGREPFTVGAGEPHLRVFLKVYASAA
jgi:hypothetical protein